MRIISRKGLVAACLGVALAGATVPAIDVWISRSIDRQGHLQAEALARRAVALSDGRLDQVLATLGKLTAANVASCQPADIETMRREVFASIPVKEVSIVSAAGANVCTHLDLVIGERRILASQPLPNAPDMLLDIVVLESGKRLLRIRKAGGGLAAMAPVELFLPRVTADGGPFAAFITLRTETGVVIANAGGKAPDDTGGGYSHEIASGKSGVKITVEIPRSRIAEMRGESRWVAFTAAGGAGVLICAVLLFRPRRKGQDPVGELERAIAAGDIVPCYQAIVDIRTGQLRGAEVLMQWRKSDGTVLPSSSFLPLAKTSGLLQAMTLALMQRVCDDAGPAIGKRPDMKIAFNLPAQLFTDDSIVTAVRQIVSRSPLKFQQIVLGLTDRDPASTLTESQRVISAFQGLGCRILIDDVGAGQSVLSCILKLGIDIIKIDKTFIDAIGNDRNSSTIVEMLVDLARNMRMDVVAEGVETFEQIVHLRDLGIRWAQGPIFTPALPGSSFMQLVEAADPMVPPAVTAPVLAVNQ